MLKHKINLSDNKAYYDPAKNDHIEKAIKKRVDKIISSYCSEHCRIRSISFHYSLYYPIIVDVVISSNHITDNLPYQLKRKIGLPNFPNINIELQISFLNM
ncbi:hypothetical protein NEF87_000418 [Candidatus Lokiarchaeum ossiferum]|uniref:Uncharacterized protein n=1 Tax=Candidatus Lokiarchaeum ossiferum TaxID=2951803 RepID=A0ABY6HLE6_9ARCH|nr:hypothetical protein NEF87_000418 [Candidatus Lokiarchaeum sp. B-35]